MASSQATEPSTIRVLIVDDHAVVRQSLRNFLKLQDDSSALPIKVVGEAVDGTEAVELASRCQPDVILLDLVMPVMDGYQATAQIKVVCPACRVIALTIHGDENARCRAAEAGCDAFIVKGAPISALIEALGQEDSHGRCNQSQEDEEG
jgi:two-component system, NarL family, response regulator LiaR